VKNFTELNKIEGQSQTLAVSTEPVIEKVVSDPYVSIFDPGLYITNYSLLMG
jgi:hypothetical protein